MSSAGIGRPADKRSVGILSEARRFRQCGPGDRGEGSMFERFATRRMVTSRTEIHLVVGGKGPPLLLLHGYPQTHVMWHRIAPQLSKRFTLVIADLPGYGASDVPKTDS